MSNDRRRCDSGWIPSSLVFTLLPCSYLLPIYLLYLLLYLSVHNHFLTRYPSLDVPTYNLYFMIDKDTDTHEGESVNHLGTDPKSI